MPALLPTVETYLETPLTKVKVVELYDVPEAMTEIVPKISLDVKADVVAIPLLLLITFVENVPVSLNVPLAPENGAVNVTETPLIGLLLVSVTFTLRAVAKG